MIGVINKLLFDFIEQNWGEEMSLRLKKESETPHTDFRMDVYYPDAEWQKQLAAAVKLTGMDSESLVWAFGRYSGEVLTRQFSGFISGATSARDVITRQPRIHNTLALSFADKTHQKTINEKFRLDELADRTVVHYVSPNQLCAFYRSLAQWVADLFGEEIEIIEPKCMHRGDHECEIHVRYLGKKGVEDKA